MRIAMNIAITIAITLAAALAPMQQAHGWAQSCADGNTDACCHLEQIGWDVLTSMKLTGIHQQIVLSKLYPNYRCSPSSQRDFDEMIPRMCQTDCWGGAIANDGSWSTMPTQAEVLNAGCTVNFFVNETCPPPPTPPTPAADISSTASASVSSTASASVSSTASTTESSSSTATNSNDGASAPLGPESEDSIGAAAPQTRAHWAFALACALMLCHWCLDMAALARMLWH